MAKSDRVRRIVALLALGSGLLKLSVLLMIVFSSNRGIVVLPTVLNLAALVSIALIVVSVLIFKNKNSGYVLAFLVCSLSIALNYKYPPTLDFFLDVLIGIYSAYFLFIGRIKHKKDLPING